MDDADALLTKNRKLQERLDRALAENDSFRKCVTMRDGQLALVRRQLAEALRGD